MEKDKDIKEIIINGETSIRDLTNFLKGATSANRPESFSDPYLNLYWQGTGQFCHQITPGDIECFNIHEMNYGVKLRFDPNKKPGSRFSIVKE